MRLWAVAVSCVLILGGYLSCLAQQPSGPRTLENLLNSDDSQKPAAVAAAAEADAGTQRPAGTASRPKDGVKHPDLDKAWADYDAAVSRVTESVKIAITRQFDAATAKGDLDEAEKWQAALEKFEKTGELPAETETKTATKAVLGDYKKARQELAKAYEAVVKNLTMEKKIAEARGIRDEAKGLEETLKPNASNVGRDRPPQFVIPPDGLVGWWSLDGNADDSSRFRNHGRVQEAMPTEDRFGRPGKAMKFNGRTAFIEVDPAASLSLVDSFTVSLWYLTSGESTSLQCMLGKNRSDGGTSLNLLLDRELCCGTHDGRSNLVLRIGGNDEVGRWIHVACTYDGEVTSGYLNGKMIIQRRARFRLSNADFPVNIGREGAEIGRYFAGSIDDVGLWKQPLSESQIRALFEQKSSVPQR